MPQSATDQPLADAHTGPSFPLGNRVARALWNACWLLLFRPSPRPMHGWRNLLLRVFGAKIARGCHIYPGVRVWAPWNLICLEQAGIGDGAILYNQAPITLGKCSVVSQGAHLCCGTHDYESPGFELITVPIVVGDHAWLAAECFVHPGVTIGEGAIIGARSVVLHDMPGWTVCAGNPCKPLKPRTPRA